MGGFALVVALAAIALLIGVPILRSSRRAPTTPEPRVQAVLDELPGGNCGACGHDSCFAAARAVAAGRASCGVCMTGGAATAERVARAMREGSPATSPGCE